jgi:hypothetical protein
MSNLLLHIVPALLVSLVLATPAFATFCQERTINTPNTADRFVDQYGAYAGASQEGGYDYAAQLRVCTDPDSTHSFAAAMRENGACVNTGRHLRSMTSHTGGSPYLGKKNMQDGDVPDYEEKRVGIQVGNHWIGTNWSVGSCN